MRRQSLALLGVELGEVGDRRLEQARAGVRELAAADVERAAVGVAVALAVFFCV